MNRSRGSWAFWQWKINSRDSVIAAVRWLQMRLTARIHNHPEIRRAMLCTADDGCYIFLYETLEDGSCAYDHLQEDIAIAKLQCLEDYGIPEDGWTQIPDLTPGCQQDWIDPVRVAGRSEGNPRWGEFERLVDGHWLPIATEQSDEREPE